MKKNLYKIFVLIFIIFFLSIIMNVKSDAEDSYIGNTDAVISFVDSSNTDYPVDPVNPEDPSKPNDNDNDNNSSTGNIGALTIDVAPSKFDFGSNKTSNKSFSINASYSGNDKLQYLQVSDRRENFNGWTVNVMQENDFTSDSGQKMTGANITIPKGETRSSNSDDPTKTGVDWLESKSVETSSSDQKVFSSNSNINKKSISTDTWNADDVTLNIPRFTSKQGKYSSSLKWSLVAGVE